MIEWFFVIGVVYVIWCEFVVFVKVIVCVMGGCVVVVVGVWSDGLNLVYFYISFGWK